MRERERLEVEMYMAAAIILESQRSSWPFIQTNSFSVPMLALTHGNV